MRCGYCGGQHPDARCRRNDKVIERSYPQPPLGQIAANLQGQRFPFDAGLVEVPPQHSLYYQQPTRIVSRLPPPHNPPSGQHQPPLLPPPPRPYDHHLAPIQPSQDYRRDTTVASTSANPPHRVHLVEVYSKMEPILPLFLPPLEKYPDALAVQTRKQRQVQRAAFGFESSPRDPESLDSPVSPHLSKLNGVAETMKKELAAARKQAALLAKAKTKEVLDGTTLAPVAFEQPIDLEDPEDEHVRADAT